MAILPIRITLVLALLIFRRLYVVIMGCQSQRHKPFFVETMCIPEILGCGYKSVFCNPRAIVPGYLFLFAFIHQFRHIIIPNLAGRAVTVLIHQLCRYFHELIPTFALIICNGVFSSRRLRIVI